MTDISRALNTLLKNQKSQSTSCFYISHKGANVSNVWNAIKFISVSTTSE